VVIFSGDGDFRKLVEAVQRKGRRVSVCSTIRTQPPMVSDELRRQADNFIELEELKPMVAREGGTGREHRARFSASTRLTFLDGVFPCPYPSGNDGVEGGGAASAAARSAVSRLKEFRDANKRAFPDFFNAPVRVSGRSMPNC